VSLSPRAAETVRRLDSLITQSRAHTRALEELRDVVMGGETRVVRDYDVSPPDPDEVAARWGVNVVVPEGDAPEWFETMMRRVAESAREG
jgi:hypothetical protein